MAEVLHGTQINKEEPFIRIERRSILVEWEGIVGLWSVPVKTYLAIGTTHPRAPVVARVMPETDDYDNYDFSDQRNWFQSIKRSSVDGTSLHGYVRRKSQAGKEMMQILFDGNRHSLTLETACPTNSEDNSLINKVLSKNWLYSEDKPPTAISQV